MNTCSKTGSRWLVHLAERTKPFLGQVKTADKSNEITATPEYLSPFQSRDAHHC